MTMDGEVRRGDDLRHMLRSARLKVTPLRLDILSHLVEARRPLSHADIQSAMSDLDRVTLYRTLESFVGADIAHQVQGLDGVWRFCAHSKGDGGCPGNHPHFLCVSCGSMICLTDQNMPRVDVPEGHEVEGKQLVVYGKCPKCASRR
ncbi:MAG: transcriptional repressor [Synergistaceae bacterium]|jgi:Fur family ferric uptake transcriptional regulator/Fur family zinc uptake transcriptional regulator|nr:transcriptional repressor [Synergistaceae bacterium]